ncbi:hypothetical protein ET495_01310 [Xylanimonas allomyrinae]|uniref:Uncharacterized protein n=1 Tax=Xylanimonas allomyrinae TaxID=2509459 RepID=A0A4P6EVT0_9MICO|nr:hypothetical protein [Xylanimonas allomyrinae]QAY62138.1 hypothetical protein ET495_01310 [Xylanimonas allomyrinae]
MTVAGIVAGEAGAVPGSVAGQVVLETAVAAHRVAVGQVAVLARDEIMSGGSVGTTLDEVGPLPARPGDASIIDDAREWIGDVNPNFHLGGE